MLGRLDGLSRVIPDTDLLIYFYSRREAVLSSQIEGTQSTLSELLLFEADELSQPKREDVREVSNYVAALRHGLSRMAGGFPLSLRLIREMHAILIRSGRGSHQNPGEFRTSQNWIGGTRPGNAAYVPPPVVEMSTCLHVFEKFLHEGAEEFPPLIQAALLHVQFESIHPFLDGNGRLGRLLIALLLVDRNVLSEPLLYPSLYLKQHKSRYYELLQQVRFEGAWEEWIEFFLEGIAVTAGQAVELSKRILELFREDEARIQALRTRAHILPVYRTLQMSPVSLITHAAKQSGLSHPTVVKGFEKMREMGILEEVTGRERHRIYRYKKYVAMLNEGTEL
jgi:Fic family protein